jgi:iron complex outermembrane receptor protein
VIAGIDYQGTWFGQDLAQDFTTSIDIFNPVYRQAIAQPSLLVSRQRQTQTQIGLYAQDQIKLGNLAFLGGLRHDWADSDTTDVLTNIHTPQNDQSTTGRVGAAYLFDIGVAPYVAFATSFQPTAGADFSGTAFEPTTGTLYEVGVKFQPKGYDSFITLSLFHLTQKHVLTPDTDPTHIGFLTQTGEVRSRGVELEGKLSVTKQLDLIGSYTYTDATVTKSNDADLGNVPLGIPRNTAALWGDYTIDAGIFKGLGFASGVRYVDKTWGDLANTLKIPSYVLVDAAIHYDLGTWIPALKRAQLSVNATNVADKTYVSECTNANCLYGLRRSVMGTMRVEW